MREALDLAGLPADQAIPLLLDRFGDTLYRLGLKVCGSEDEAADLLQETFLNAYRRWGQFEGRSEPTSWLYTIAVRACRRKHRRRSGEPSTIASFDELLPTPGATIPIAAAGEDPETGLLRREVVARVDEAIATLPIGYRMPLVLKEIAELPVKAVAKVLGLEEATVKTRLHRARLQLRRALETELPRTEAPPPGHDRRICLDLLRAKLEALDRGVAFDVAPADLCARCEALFSTLDLASDACRHLAAGEVPEQIRAAVMESFAT